MTTPSIITPRTLLVARDMKRRERSRHAARVVTKTRKGYQR